MSVEQRRYLLWFFCVAAVWTVISTASYYPNDGDGTLYSNLAIRIAQEQFSELFAVGWYDYNKTYGFDAPESRYFYEHPPGLFILPWLLSKLGFPLSKLTLIAETIYQLVLLFFSYQLVKKWSDRETAGWSVIALLCMPVSFWYVLRPVHETPMLLSLVAALYFISCYDRHRVLVLSMLVLAGMFAGMMKGIMVLPVFVVCAVAGVVLQKSNRLRWEAAVTCSLAFGLGAYSILTVFDKYRMWTIGDTFWLPYLKIQIWGRALEHSTPTEVLYRTIKHGLLYAGALLYYSLPWGLGGILYGFLQLRSKILTRENIFTHTRPLMFICAAGALVLSFPFSVFARVSVRYIYSAYYLLAILGFLLVFQPLKTYVQDHPLVGRYRVNDVLTLAVIIWTVSKIGAVFLETS